MLTDREFLRYQRQVMLPEVGDCGQKSLINSKVLIVGCGGLGSSVALQLAGAGVGHMVLCDNDSVELSNLHRQLSYREFDLKKAKVEALAEQITSLNSSISVRRVNRKMCLGSLMIEVSLADLVIDCSDNFPTRQDINKACQRNERPLISGAAIGWNGQVVYLDGQPKSGCYHCLYEFNESPEAAKCSESGVIGPIVNAIGSLQSMLAIKAITRPDSLTSGDLVVFDGQAMSYQKFLVEKDESCVVCNKGSNQ